MVFTIADFLSQWEAAGVFDLVLPFLLIFAVVYAILLKSKILGESKGISVIISIVIGLLALRLDFVSSFFREVFPRLGVGLAVLLVLLVLSGLFIGELTESHRRIIYWILIGIGVVITIVVLSGSFSAYGWGTDWTSNDLIVWVVSLALLIGVIIAISVAGGGKKEEKEKD